MMKRWFLCERWFLCVLLTISTPTTTGITTITTKIFEICWLNAVITQCLSLSESERKIGDINNCCRFCKTLFDVPLVPMEESERDIIGTFLT